MKWVGLKVRWVVLLPGKQQTHNLQIHIRVMEGISRSSFKGHMFIEILYQAEMRISFKNTHNTYTYTNTYFQAIQARGKY